MQDLDSSYASVGDAQLNVDAYLNSPLMALDSQNPSDILEYWKSQSVSFPVMSRIAKDGGRVLTKYRSSLHTDNVEVFVTTQNLLFGYLKDDEDQDCFEVMKDVMPEDVDHDSLPRLDFCCCSAANSSLMLDFKKLVVACQMPVGSNCSQLFHILEFSDEMPVGTYAWELSFGFVMSNEEIPIGLEFGILYLVTQEGFFGTLLEDDASCNNN
ncbi:putative AC transposase [Bienertia sinuspersici]